MEEPFTNDYTACAVRKQILIKEALNVKKKDDLLAANIMDSELLYDAPFGPYVEYKKFIMLDVYNKTGISLIDYMSLSPSETQLLLHSLSAADKDKRAAEENALKKKGIKTDG